MDDTAKDTVTIKFKGRELQAAPFTKDQVAALGLARSVSEVATLRIMGSLVGKSIGDQEWEAMVISMAMCETTIDEIMDVLLSIAKGGAEDETAPADGK